MSQLLEQNSLAHLACQIIETTAFAFAQVSDAADATMPEIGVLCACISFKGPVQGELRLAARFEAAATIAGNLLGLDSEDIEDEQAMQGIHELLNIIAGQWLTHQYGVQAVFQLGIPQACEATIDDDQETADLLVDDFPVRLQLCLN